MRKGFEHLRCKMNQLANVSNRHQGPYKRVLFVCSAGLLRSATAAAIFAAEPYNWNTRTAGADVEYALNPVNQALLAWADKVYIFGEHNLDNLEWLYGDVLNLYREKFTVLNIDDCYEYRNPELIATLKELIPNEA